MAVHEVGEAHSGNGDDARFCLAGEREAEREMEGAAMSLHSLLPFCLTSQANTNVRPPHSARGLRWSATTRAAKGRFIPSDEATLRLHNS